MSPPVGSRLRLYCRVATPSSILLHLVIGRRFILREFATRWAQQERQAIERGLRE
jgi:hypothetical protein